MKSFKATKPPRPNRPNRTVFMTDLPTDTYLKTQQVARALGVSVSTIKRWVDSGAMTATRTLGKHRLIARSEAERFAREQGLRFDGRQAVDRANEEGVVGPGPRDTGLTLASDLVERIAVALKRGRVDDARNQLIRAYDAAGAVALADDVVRPVMERLGDEWDFHSIDVYQEHRATRAVKQAVFELLQRFPGSDPGDRPGAALAIGAAPEDDPYMLPGLMCELTLREMGWDVMNLGVNLPLASLGRAVRAHRPALVWLSVSHLEDVGSFVREYASFFAAAASTRTAVVLGGQALTPDVRARLVAASFGDRMAHLAEFARRVRPDAEAAKSPNWSNEP
jgi:excisionase family DNA binding protein